MNDLIEALLLISKYENPSSPTHCEHDVLTVMVPWSAITDRDDQERLGDLGFHENEFGYIASYVFGSA